MKPKSNTIYINKEADTLIKTEIPIAIKQLETHAVDLAIKELPKREDPLKLYLPIIRALFQSLLEHVHQLLGAKRTMTDKQAIEENYAKEETLLITKTNALYEDIRVLKKLEKALNDNLKHIIKNWTIALFFLVLLSFSETLLNYKIFLPISSNNVTALVGATGISISFFIICHVFPNILNVFETKVMKWLVGLGIVSMVTALLYSFAKMRLSFASHIDTLSTENLSEWNFVILNLILFLSGVALTLIYKPNKQIFENYHKHKIISDQIKTLSKDYQEAEKRLTVLLQEKNNELGTLDGILLMAHHYEKTISAEYMKVFAIWSKENMIARKDKVQPNAFLEIPEPLTTYFDDIKFQTYTTNTNTIN